MSFKFNWRFFDIEDLQQRCQEALTESIAQTRRPPSIAAPIRAVNIDFGTKPPKLKFRSIPAVGLNRTHIVFDLKYHGDATLTLETEVQANVLNEPFCDPNYPKFVRPKVIGALEGLRLPFRLMLKNIELDTLVDIVYTPDGVVVNFVDDPIKKLEIESSMDNFPFVRAMISQMLKHQLTVSFYEDIPETIWTSTSPRRQPPDPYFGARRWSQHLKRFVKYSSYLFHTFTFTAPSKCKPFDTMALNVNCRNLSTPLAILNRASLSSYAKSRETTKVDGTSVAPQPENLGKFLEECSSSQSSKSSTLGSISDKQTKPKRRVISLKKMSAASRTAATTSTPPNATPELAQEEEDDVLFRDSDRIPSLPRSYIPTSRLASRSQWRANSVRKAPADGSNLSSPRYSPQLPHTPLFQASDYSALADDDDGKVPTSDIPLLMHRFAPEHRRFSTPEQAQTSVRRSPPNKQRTTSLQPNRATELEATPILRPHSPILPRSPGRYPSTNDLMNK